MHKIQTTRQNIMTWPLKARVAFFVLAGFLILNLMALAYPSNRFLPATKIGAVSVGGKNPEQAQAALNEYLKQTSLSLGYGEQEQSIMLSELGAAVDESNAQAHLEQNRRSFLPLVQLGYRAFNAQEFSPNVDENVLRTQLAVIELSAEQQVADNLLQFDERTGAVTVDAPEGSILDVDAALETLKNSFNFTAEAPAKIDLPTRPLVPEDQISNIEEARLSAEQLVETELTLELDGEEIVPELKDRIAWVSVQYMDDTAMIALDEEAIKAYIVEIAEAYNTEAELQTVELLDGEEVTRSGGGDGRSVKVARVVNDIVNYLQHPPDEADEPTEALTMATAVLEAPVTYERAYTNTSKGLDAKIKHWVSTNAGVYGVGVLEIGGDAHSAYYNSSRAFVAASTYKLFLAYIVLEDVQNGKYSLSTTISSGHTVQDALEDAIVNSGNETAISLAEQAGGWSAIDARLSADGFDSTTLDNYNIHGDLIGDKFTTITDQVELLRRLYNGSLLSSSNTQLLLGWMEDQVWRQGIPAGVDGTVADKVGFLENYLHDSAIVYTPTTDFILVIFTEDSTWESIADLASLVEDHIVN